MTDDANPYNRAKHTFIGHETVVHSAGEYVRGTGGTAVHVNTAESVHALLKRGVMGTYHHWSKTGILRLLVEKDIATNQEIRLMIEQRAQLTMDEIDQTDLPGTAEERAEIELSMEKYLSDLATAFDIP